ncbi:MAG: sensor domain-containing diguanylate cyclase [Candidatus Electrothrix sp. AR4]|nr:sensor domain-containing diguanylate cyclase [Candidatus Electrothrix sp. AR4]
MLSYEKNLAKIIKMTDEGAMAKEIDAVVKVNDKMALRGLSTLDREIAQQVRKLSMSLAEKLHFLANTVPMINWSIMIFLVLVAGFSILIFNSSIIKPINIIREMMNILAEDKTEITIHGTELKNEIGQMACALEKFKKNITERKKAQEKLKTMALTDPLTELDNRKRFNERIVEAINGAKRQETNMACMMIDLDKFKPINDTYGHIMGDKVLKIAAKRLKQACRKTDFVSRLGGDEFAILATSIDKLNNVSVPAQRIIDLLGLPIYLHDETVQIGGSVGIAVFPIDGEEPDELIKKADTALYAAKAAGRNTVRFYNAKL